MGQRTNLTTTPHDVLAARYRRERDRNLRNRHGIGVEDYERMLAEQGGACAICDKTPSAEEILRIDHCHATGRIRGLLCNRCNLAIGYLRDDSAAAMRACLYLAQPLGAAPMSRPRYASLE